MMDTQPSIFDRNFQPGDEAEFATLVRPMVGERCVAWRKGYGRSGSLHFGQMVERSSAPTKAVYKNHGLWVVGLWDCDRRFTPSSGATIDNRNDGDDALFAQLGVIEGAVVQDIRLDPRSLSLRIHLSGQMMLELVTDPNCSSTSEQWAIELPSGRAVVAFGEQRWALQENR